MSTRYDLADPESREAGLAAAVGRRTPGPAGGAPDRHRLRIGRGRLRPGGGAAAARRQGPRARHAAAGAGLGQHHPRRPRQRPAGLGARAGRALLAGSADHRRAASSRPCGGTWATPAAPWPSGCPTTRSRSSSSAAPVRWRCRSANLTGRPAATDADEAERMLGDTVEVILDGGPSAGHRPPPRSSTARAAAADPARGRGAGGELRRSLEELGTELEQSSPTTDPSR